MRRLRSEWRPSGSARNFGPAVISGEWYGWWIYWLGPLVGTLLAVAAYWMPGWERRRIAVAESHHFDHDLCDIHIRMQW
jgi:aquaporin Z